MEVIKPTVKIQRRKDGGDYQDIVAGSNQDVLPGEHIDLKLVVDPVPRVWPPSQIQWTSEGIVFRSYTATDDNAFLLLGAGFGGDITTFHWADTGLGRVTTGKAWIGNVPIQASGMLNVQKPIVT